MREFAQTLSDFHKGLRPDANTPRNSGFATELYNTRCGVAGLEVPPLIIYPISGTPAVSWPLPQLVKIYDLNFINSGLYFVNYATGSLTIKKVATDYSLSTVFTKAGVNTRFTIADFGYFQIWAGVGLSVKRKIADSLLSYEWSEITVNGVAPPVRCVCNFRGQLIAGIYTPSAELIGGVEDNIVAWSQIGSVDPTIMFDPSYSFIDRRSVGGSSSTTTSFSSVLEANSGYWREASSFYTSSMFFGLYPPTSPTLSRNCFNRFPSVTIPAGATITSAFIRFTAASSLDGAGCNAKCHFNNVDNAVAPTSTPEAEALVLTSGVEWNNVVAFTALSEYDTPDLSTELQTIINRAGWASGQAVMVVVKDNGSSSGGYRKVTTNDSGVEGLQAVLHVIYTVSTLSVKQPYKRTSGNYRTGPTSAVHRVIPLGNGVMVYCADKIFYMRAASVPEPTFGIVPIESFGIPSTFCAEGDDKEHVYIDTNKQVWKIGEDLKPKLLGYKEFITTLTGTIIISKNENYGDYYISNGTKTYLLSQYGLSQWFQYPTSLVWEGANKRLIGPIAVASDVSAYMASDIYDFGVRALKTITTMEIGATGQVMTANIDYKYKVTDSAFTASRFKTASNFGAVTPLVSGIEFKMRVKGADYTKFDLDYLTVRYKYVDKRMIRGVYATDAKVLSRPGR